MQRKCDPSSVTDGQAHFLMLGPRVNVQEVKNKRCICDGKQDEGAAII